MVFWFEFNIGCINYSKDCTGYKIYEGYDGYGYNGYEG